MDLVQAIEAKVRENHGYIVVDEVTAGVGRTGKWFGYEYYHMSPDIVAIGKGIGNGYPVSVIALSKLVAELLEKSNFKYAQSHQNDPLGCAVVKEVISIIEHNNYIQKASEIGLVLEQELLRLEKYHCVKEIRGRGLMFVIEFRKDEDLPLEKVHKELFDAGYISGVNLVANLLRFYPPLTIEIEHIVDMVNALDNILSKTTNTFVS